MDKSSKRRLVLSKAGYTLIEMLLVLSILLIIIATSITAVPRYLEKREIESFLQQLSHDLHYAQTLAIHDQSYYQVSFSIEKNEYIISKYTKRILTRNLPEEVTFLPKRSSLNTNVTVYPSGLISNSGTWIFKTKRYTYEFKIYLGEGRHTYHEQ